MDCTRNKPFHAQRRLDMMTPEWKKKRSEAAKKAARTKKLSKRARAANVTRGKKGRKAAAKKAVTTMRKEGKL
jgi:hypothetical protein